MVKRIEGKYNFGEPADLERLQKNGEFLFRVMCGLRNRIFMKIDDNPKLNNIQKSTFEKFLKGSEYNFPNEKPTNNSEAVAELLKIINNLKEWAETNGFLEADFDPYDLALRPTLFEENFFKRHTE